MKRPRTMTCLAIGSLLAILATAAFADDDFPRNVLRENQDGKAAVAPQPPPRPMPLAPAAPRGAATDEAGPTRPPAGDRLEASERRLEEALRGVTEATLRDPTQPSEAMQELVDPLRMEQQGGTRGLALPQIVLRGRIIGQAKLPAAMIEIEQVLHVIESGTEITVPTPNVGLGSVTLRVTELTAQEIRIEVMPLRQVIVLR